MSGVVHRFFTGDDIKFRAVYKVNGVEQTPSSGIVRIVNKDGGIVVNDVASTISSNEVQYIYNDAAKNEYTIYFTTDFGDDERTGAIKFRVVDKDGKQS